MRWIALLQVVLDVVHCLHYLADSENGMLSRLSVCGGTYWLRQQMGTKFKIEGGSSIGMGAAWLGVMGKQIHHYDLYEEKFMLDMIDFMERMGGDAQLFQASSEELAAALVDTEVTPEQRVALLARDAERLGELLGTKPVCIMVAPPGPPGSPIPGPDSVPPPPPPLLPEEEMEKYYGDA